MIRVAIFGDSLSDPETYVDVADKTWAQQMEESLFPVDVVYNGARGGAVSGGANDFVYNMGGEVLEVPGVVGQIEAFLLNPVHFDVAVLWPGTNDLVIACHLDPFTTVGGVTVVATPPVTDFREPYIADHGKYAYANFIVDKYTIPNIQNAVNKLNPYGQVVVVGPFALEQTVVAAQEIELMKHTRKRLALSIINTFPIVASLSNIIVGAVDEIHLNNFSQREVMKQIYGAI